MLGRWLAGMHGRLEQLPPVAGEAPPNRRTRPYPRTRAEGAAAAESRARWLAHYQEVRRRFQAGERLLAIGRALGLALEHGAPLRLRGAFSGTGRASALSPASSIPT